MYGYQCPNCGANLDPGEKCTCQDKEKDDKEGNENNMDNKNEILNALELQAELNQESIRYINDLVERAKKGGIDDSELVGMQIGTLASLEVQSIIYITNLINIAKKFNVNAEEVLVGELNSAYGTEYKLIDNKIAKYKELRDNILETIEAERYEVLLNSAKKDWENAINNEATARAKLADIYKQNATLFTAYETAIREGDAATAERLKNSNQELIDAYESARDTCQGYSNDIATYENAIQISAEEGTAAASRYLSERNEAYANSSNSISKITGEEVSGLEKKQSEFSSKLILLLQDLTSYSEDSSDTLKNNINTTLKEINELGFDLENAGINARTGYFDATSGTWIDTSGLIQSIDDMLASTEGFKDTSIMDIDALREHMVKNPIIIPDSTKSSIDDVNSGLEDAQENTRLFRDELDKLPNKVTVDVTLNTIGFSGKFARGTPGAHEGPAVVNDGNGPELIQSKDGSFRMVQSKGAALTYLNEGDRVYTAEQSRSMLRRIPHYANGIGNHGTTVSASTTLFGIPALLGKTAKELAETFTNTLGDALSKGLKENAEKMTEKFDKAVEVLDLQLEFGHIDEKQYFEQLKTLRDEYLTQGTKEWYETTQEIYEHITETAEEAKDNYLDTLEYELDMGLISEREYYDKLKEYRDTYLEEGTDEWRDYTSKIFNFYKDKAGEVLEEVADKQEDLLGRLEDHTTLTKTISVDNFYEDGSSSTWSELNTSDKELKEITKFVDNLDSVEERLKAGGFDENFIKEHMDKIRQMSVEEGLEYTNLLLNASDETFRKHIDIQQETFNAVKRLSAEAYKDEYAEAVNESVDIWTSALETAGFEVPEGFFDIGVDSAAEFCEGFERHIESLFDPIREKVASLISGLPFSGNSGSSYTSQSSYSPTFNFYGSQETVSQQLIAAKNATTLERLRGN